MRAGKDDRKKEKKPSRTVRETEVKERKANEFRWSSAISFSAQSTAMVLRSLLERMELNFRRERSERPYSQLYAIVPFPRVAYVFRFRVTAGATLIIDIYDTHPGTSGPLTYIELPGLNDGNIELARKILRGLARALPRPPWKFTWLQRFQHGLLNPDILRARKSWRSIGVAP